MNHNYIIIIVVLIFIYGVATTVIIGRGKNKKTYDILQGIDKGIDCAQPIAEAIKPFLPGMADKIIELILKFAKSGVESAEKEYKDALNSDPAAADNRKAEAVDMIAKTLKLYGIPITEDTTKLINAIIPVFVMFLPKTHENIATPEAVEADT